MPPAGRSPTPPAAWAVFVDFDGTVTDLDTFDVLVRHYAGTEAWLATERGLLDGSLSLRDALQLQASYVRAGLGEAAAILRRSVRFDPGFAPFAAACRARAIPLVVVSSGIEPIVRWRLEEVGLGELPVIANGVEAGPGGWTIRFRDPVPNGTDKAAVIDAARERGRRTIFVGDGRSDFDAALRADLVFAKRGRALERFLWERGIAHERFDSFADVGAALERRGVLAGAPATAR